MIDRRAVKSILPCCNLTWPDNSVESLSRILDEWGWVIKDIEEPVSFSEMISWAGGEWDKGSLRMDKISTIYDDRWQTLLWGKETLGSLEYIDSQIYDPIIEWTVHENAGYYSLAIYCNDIMHRVAVDDGILLDESEMESIYPLKFPEGRRFVESQAAGKKIGDFDLDSIFHNDDERLPKSLPVYLNIEETLQGLNIPIDLIDITSTQGEAKRRNIYMERRRL